MQKTNNKKQNHTSHRTLHTSQRGITLIALIITIIVMLILVGVTINVALNGGLFQKADDATKLTQEAAEKEELLMAVVAATGTDGKVNFTYLDKNLPTDWIGSNGTYTTPKGRTYTVSEKGKITEGENGNTLPEGALISMYRAGENCTVENCTNEGHLHIGDYVSYTPDTTVTRYYPDGESETNIGVNTGYTTEEGATELQVVEQETLNWRVLGADGDNVLLISETPTTEEIHFYGHIGYNNYENILNTACSTLYSKSGIGTARSITMEDIDIYLDGNNFDKTTFVHDGKFNDGYYGHTNTNIISKFDYDSENNILTKLPEGEITTLSLTTNAYYYMASEYITDPIKLDLLKGSYDYWVASRNVYANDSGAGWSIGKITSGYVDAFSHCVCYSEGENDGYLFGFRPVVSLSSNVTIDDISKL